MTPQIKSRINQIRRGEVPDGYKKTKVGIVSEEWQEARFKNMFSRLNRKNNEGNTNVLTISAQHGLISQEDFFNKSVASEDKSNYFLLRKGEYAYNKSYSNGYPFGALKQLEKYESGIVSPLYICFSATKENKCPDFFSQYFEAGKMNSEIQAFAQEGARNHGLLNISVEDFFNSNIVIPPLAEQEKIAEILAAQDKVIALKEKLLEEKKKQKKYLMQQLLTGKKRLPGFSGDWEKTRLSSIADFCFDSIDPSKHPNETFCVYSLPAFDNSMMPEILLGSEINSSKFKLNHGVILFNKLNVRQKRVWLVRGDLLPNSVSSTEFLPLIIHGICEEFLHYYLSSDSVVNFFIRKSSGTSNSQQRILPTDLMKLSVFTPPREEQIAIAKILSNADKEISTIQKSIDQEKQKKKALMQLLLTGIVRV